MHISCESWYGREFKKSGISVAFPILPPDCCSERRRGERKGRDGLAGGRVDVSSSLHPTMKKNQLKGCYSVFKGNLVLTVSHKASLGEFRLQTEMPCKLRVPEYRLSSLSACTLVAADSKKKQLPADVSASRQVPRSSFYCEIIILKPAVTSICRS